MRLVCVLAIVGIFVPGICSADCNVRRVYHYGQIDKVTASFSAGIPADLTVVSDRGGARHYTISRVDGTSGDVVFKWDDEPPATGAFVVIGPGESLSFGLGNVDRCTLKADTRGVIGLSIHLDGGGQVRDSFMPAEAPPPF